MSFANDLANDIGRVFMAGDSAAGFALDVVLHTGRTDIVVPAIFNNPSTIAIPAGGGYLADESIWLRVAGVKACFFEKGLDVTIEGDLYTVTRPPEHDGAGMAKLFVARTHASQSKPSISY